MIDKQHRIQALIHSIVTYLQDHGVGMCGVDLTVDKLKGMDLSNKKLIDLPPQGTRHDEVLTNAIAEIDAPKLRDIKIHLAAAKDDLIWREDKAQFYPPGADLGEGYTKCNLHALLIGPAACGYQHPDFRLGIFMLGPRTLYRDHNHDPPELYLNLSKRSGWRFGTPDWQDYPAGSFIWNTAGRTHAIRVYEQPFLSVFLWLENVNSSCNVIHFDDWAEVEQALETAY